MLCTSPSLFKKSKEASWSLTNVSLEELHKRIRPSLSLCLWFLIIVSCLNSLFFDYLHLILNPSQSIIENLNLSTCCRKTTDCFLDFSSLTALLKNWFNFFMHSFCCRSQLWKDPESIKMCWKPDCVLEEVTTWHKGIYSIILKIQEPLWLVKDHMWWPCGFLLFLAFYVQALVQSFLLEDWNPLISIDYSRAQYFYKIWCSSSLSQKQSIEPSLATSLALFV